MSEINKIYEGIPVSSGDLHLYLGEDYIFNGSRYKSADKSNN